jgi:hypothetical protein
MSLLLMTTLRNVRIECIGVETDTAKRMASGLNCRCQDTCRPLEAWLRGSPNESRWWNLEQCEVLLRAAMRADTRTALTTAAIIVRQISTVISGLRLSAAELHCLEQWHADCRNSIEKARVLLLFRHLVERKVGEREAQRLYSAAAKRTERFPLCPYIQPLIDEHGLVINQTCMQALSRAADDYIECYRRDA